MFTNPNEYFNITLSGARNHRTAQRPVNYIAIEILKILEALNLTY